MRTRTRCTRVQSHRDEHNLFRSSTKFGTTLGCCYFRSAVILRRSRHTAARGSSARNSGSAVKAAISITDTGCPPMEKIMHASSLTLAALTVLAAATCGSKVEACVGGSGGYRVVRHYQST